MRECASEKELQNCVDNLEKCNEEEDDIEELKLENTELIKEVERLSKEVDVVRGTFFIIRFYKKKVNIYLSYAYRFYSPLHVTQI